MVFLFGMTLSLQAQVVPDSVATDSVAIDSVSFDSSRVDPSSSLADSLRSMRRLQEVEKPEPITVWERNSGAGFKTVTNDSLLRWQIWPNWGEYYAYRKDVVSFRQGTTGRVDAYQVSGYSPDEQSLSLNGLDLSNPLTGYVNYNYVPNHKVGELRERMGAGYESEVILKDFYILKPISYLNYEEAKYNFRNLEFMVAQNFNERTNLELSFWDRRDGDSYPRNEVVGSQIFGKLYHYLNQRVQIRAMYLRNQFQKDESFGYLVSDPLAFPFGRFGPSPRVSTAGSDELRRDLHGGFYFRPDSLSPENIGIEFSASKNEYNMEYSSDSLDWDLRHYQASAFKSFDMTSFSLKAEGGVRYHRFKNDRVFDIGSWSSLFASGRMTLSPFDAIRVSGNIDLEARSDGFQSLEYGALAKLAVNEKAEMLVSGAVFSRAPEIQHLYWASELYKGNESLKNESGISLYGKMNIQFGDRVNGGVSARFKQIENDVFLDADSTFSNSSEYSTLSGTVFGEFSNHLFEIESSATIHALNNLGELPVGSVNDFSEGKLWIRNNAWVKGYAFDRAAYVKLGVRTLFSPLPYGSRFYNTGAQFWQSNSTQSQIPAFFRMDAELSARVRAIMVVIRWENALDGIGQAGYFESATFPMPARRLIVGIRAQFRN
jgi:hypothetical protein